MSITSFVPPLNGQSVSIVSAFIYILPLLLFLLNPFSCPPNSHPKVGASDQTEGEERKKKISTLHAAAAAAVDLRRRRAHWEAALPAS